MLIQSLHVEWEVVFTCDQVTLAECPVAHAVKVEVVHSLTEVLLCELGLS